MKHKRHFKFIMLAAMLLAMPMTLFAQAVPPASAPISTSMIPPNMGQGQDVFFFAYPGAKCPGGSQRCRRGW